MSSDMVRSFTGILYFFSESTFHLFLYWSSSNILLSSDWILGPALSHAVCSYETRYWARPFLQCNLNIWDQLAPTPMILIIKESFYWNVFVKKKKPILNKKNLRKELIFFFKVSMGFIFREKGLDPKTHVFYCS